MTEISRPWAGTTWWDAGPYTDAQWAEMHRALFGSMHGSNAGKRGVLDIGFSDGLRVLPRTAGANMSVDLNAGSALVDGRVYFADAVNNLAIAAHPLAELGMDYVVLRSDVASQIIRPHVITGTPAASPTLPTLDTSGSPYYETSLGVVYVAAGVTSILTAAIMDARSPALTPQRVTMDVVNGDAGVLYPGDVVCWTMVNSFRVAKTSSPNNVNVAGVVQDRGGTLDTVRICVQGLTLLKRTGSISIGTPLSTSATPGKAAAGTSSIFAR